MAFDDIVRRSFDTLVRDLNSALQSERNEAARQAKNVADESLATLLADAQAVAEQRGMAAGREEGLAEGRRLGFHQGRQEGYDAGKSDGYRIGKEEGFVAGKGAGANAERAEQASAERVADSIRAIDRSRSLSETLDTLASAAGRETTRAAVFLVQDGQLRGWRFIGFGPAFDRAADVEAPLADGGIIEEAVRTKTAVTRDSSEAGAAPRLAEVPDGCEMLAVPIAVGGRVVAALYADQHGGGTEGRLPRPALETMTRYAARCLEVITAIRAAKLMTDGEQRPSEQAAAAIGDDDSSAQRYAKLLVSEIKLYHSAEVAAGRRERDLGTRLGGEIARARSWTNSAYPLRCERPPTIFTRSWCARSPRGTRGS